MTGWLDSIQLVTLDGPGVLFDWRAGLQRVGVEDPAEVARLMTQLGELASAEPFRRWGEVVRLALTEVRPDLRPAAIGLFATELGRLPLWPDAIPALNGLGDLVQVGLVANGDAQHHLDAAQACRCRWDVCVSSEEIRAHLQTERAWDAIVRAGVSRAAVTRDAWLHVSTSGQGLEWAKARGLRTCLLLRPGAADQVHGDLRVPDLRDLKQQLLTAKDGPLLVELTSEVAEPLRTEWAQWLTSSALPAMQNVPGVRRAHLYEREDGSLCEQYLFGGRREVTAWQTSFAAEQRAAVRARFGEAVTRQVRVARQLAAV